MYLIRSKQPRPDFQVDASECDEHELAIAVPYDLTRETSAGTFFDLDRLPDGEGLALPHLGCPFTPFFDTPSLSYLSVPDRWDSAEIAKNREARMFGEG